MKAIRNIIEIDEEKCNGCGQCVIACAESAIRIVDGKARLVSETYCDGLGACLGDCPVDAIRIVQREAEVFDEEATVAHVAELNAAGHPTMPSSEQIHDEWAHAKDHHGHCCPGAALRNFAPDPAEQAPDPAISLAVRSALFHWPVQMRLVPPSAPFLQGAHILAAADCVPVAHPAFHVELLPGKAVLLGCPKFEDPQYILDYYTRIFTEAHPRRITVAVMEVPCCSALPRLILAARERAGSLTPVDLAIVGARGDILDRHSLAPASGEVAS